MNNRVLVADDDESLVRTLTWILKEHGYEVFVCPGGESLFDRLEEIKPALLLLDIMMPKVDGLQLLERLKQDERYRDADWVGKELNWAAPLVDAARELITAL